METIKSVKNVETVNVDFINKTFFECADKHTDLLCDELEENEMYSISLVVKTLEFNDESEEYEEYHSDVTKKFSSKKVEKLLNLGGDLFDSLSKSGCDINEVSFGHYNNDRAFFQIKIERECGYKIVFTCILNKSKIL